MPVHLREDVVQESEHQGCLSSPVQLCRGHAVRAHSVDPPPVLDAGHLVFPILREHFYAPVSLGDIRFEDDEGFPLCRRLPRSGPFPEGVDHGETSRPPEVSIIPLPLSGPSALQGRLVLWGSLSGPSAPGDCSALAGEHPEVSPQCPRVGRWSAAVLSQWCSGLLLRVGLDVCVCSPF